MNFSCCFLCSVTNQCCHLATNTQMTSSSFADDTVIVSLLTKGENCHGTVVNDFMTRCDSAFLQINIKKTRDMVIDFRSCQLAPQPTRVKGQKMEGASSYKYLGLIINNKLRFDTHVDAVCKKVTLSSETLYF